MRKKLGKKLVNARKIVYKDIEFKSHLELYMFRLLEVNNFEFQYEGQSFQVLDSFSDTNNLYAKHNKSFIQRGKRKVIGVKYTPDFLVFVNKQIRFVIETKGRPNESFPIRLKMFRKWVVDNNKNWDIFIPTNQKQCEQTIELMKQIISNGTT
jgi:hypothetical protein